MSMRDPAFSAAFQLTALFSNMASLIPSVPLPRPSHDGRYSQKEVAGYVAACKAEMNKGNKNVRKLREAFTELKQVVAMLEERDHGQQERINELELLVAALVAENDRLQDELEKPVKGAGLSISFRQ